MLDGASTLNAIVGWIVLLVSAPSCCLWFNESGYDHGWDSGNVY